jgi:hypothetical protein
MERVVNCLRESLKCDHSVAEGSHVTKRIRVSTTWVGILVLASACLASWATTGRAEESPGESAAPPPAGAQVARAIFARAIVDREPQDPMSSFDADADKIFFFTELVGLEGQTVRHRWELAGQVVSEVEFKVGAPRWRVYSSKRLVPGQAGTWTVSVVDETGRMLHSETLGTAYADEEPGADSTPPAAPAEP